MLTDIFPFYAEVWGTVSDWVMIAVTAVTAYFLYNTLNSQRIVQKAQQRITDIEEKKYLDSIYPSLDMEFYNDLVDLKDSEATINFSFKVKNNAATAENIDLELSNTSVKVNGLGEKLTIPLLRKNEEISKIALTAKTECEYISLESHFSELPDVPLYHFEFDFNLTYSDTDGNKYKQEFSYTNQSRHAHVVKKSPIKIS